MIPLNDGTRCPLCGMDNRCGHVAGDLPGTCWCDKAHFPKEILEHLPACGVCICETCLERLKSRFGQS
ncbi:cysteine-rich CWC family protein [Alicyclobacillus hesperidum]|uniref:cysteine-rich CWC family protein n=1 Tax=Alicyclobacillus hesperidum TaxID=89784 RepID=UPI003B42F88C